MGTTLFFRHALLPTGWAPNVRLTMEHGVFTSIEANAPGTGQTIALPGMPNLHSHSFQRAIAGLTEVSGGGDDNFWSWREMMYRFALTMNPDDVEAVATHAFIEMLEGGFTAVAEFHYLHHAPDGAAYGDIGEMAARIAAAARNAGLSLLLLPVFYAHAGFGGKPPTAGQRRFINSLDSYTRLLERCEALGATGIAPHSLRAATPDELAQLTQLAGTRPLHIHIAEQTGEVAECLAWSGTRPVAWLLGHAEVGPNWCLVHATHADAAERDGMAASGAVVGLCPITEANLGDGIFPAHRYGGAFGLGSDSNVLISAAQEIRMLEYAQRLLVQKRNVMATSAMPAPATALYARAVAGGAQALGVAGGIALGAPASFVTLAGEDPDLALAEAVFAARGPAVRDVWVDGIQRVSAGRHPLADSVKKRFDAVVKKLTA